MHANEQTLHCRHQLNEIYLGAGNIWQMSAMSLSSNFWLMPSTNIHVSLIIIQIK